MEPLKCVLLMGKLYFNKAIFKSVVHTRDLGVRVTQRAPHIASLQTLSSGRNRGHIQLERGERPAGQTPLQCPAQPRGCSCQSQLPRNWNTGGERPATGGAFRASGSLQENCPEVALVQQSFPDNRSCPTRVNGLLPCRVSPAVRAWSVRSCLGTLWEALEGCFWTVEGRSEDRTGDR